MLFEKGTKIAYHSWYDGLYEEKPSEILTVIEPGDMFEENDNRFYEATIKCKKQNGSITWISGANAKEWMETHAQLNKNQS